MPILIPLICLAIAGSVASPSAFDPYQGPQPIAVIVQFDPWATVVGADTPHVAIYETGEIIFVSKGVDRLVYRHANLSTEEMADVRRRIDQMLGRTDLNPYYNLAGNITDQPETMMYLRSGEKEWVARVYGLTAPNMPADQPPQPSDQPPPADPLAHLIGLHAWLCNVSVPESEEWIPRYVEVMFWDFSYDGEPAVPWPDDWPAFDSERSVRRAELRTVFLDGDMLPALRQFLAKVDANGSVEVEGRKWAVTYRYAFPSEPVWRDAFAAVDWSRFPLPPIFDADRPRPPRVSWITVLAVLGLLLLLAILGPLIYSRRRPLSVLLLAIALVGGCDEGPAEDANVSATRQTTASTQELTSSAQGLTMHVQFPHPEAEALTDAVEADGRFTVISTHSANGAAIATATTRTSPGEPEPDLRIEFTLERSNEGWRVIAKRQYSHIESLWVWGFAHNYRVAEYLETAANLQQLNVEERVAQLRATAKDPKRAARLYPLCRMLFAAKPGEEFRAPLLGKPLNPTGKDWPLEPIALFEGVPFLVVSVYSIAGYPEQPEGYLDYCLSNCAWRKEKFQPLDSQQLRDIAARFIAKHSVSNAQFILDQVE